MKVVAQDLSGRIQKPELHIHEALLLRKTPDEYLQSIFKHYKVIDWKPCIRTAIVEDISRELFDQMWTNCEIETSKNELIISVWNEIPKLRKLGKQILKSIQNR